MNSVAADSVKPPAASTGVLLANLGTPEAPTSRAVRQFLRQFLSDPRVVEAPRWIWWFALNAVILPIRPRRSAQAYRQIWTQAGSPLLVQSRALAERLQSVLQPSGCRVALGMTYGNPTIATALEQLRTSGMRRLVILPLYPQYSGTTTAAVFDRVTNVLQSWRSLPGVHFIDQYGSEPLYIEAIANNIREHWRIHGHKHLLFSFHSIPQRYIDAGDPYLDQCRASAHRIAAALALTAGQWSLSFQSQVARQQWLQPYTDQWLLERARSGGKQVTVACPGFSIDNLETLEEIALRNRKLFLEAGGEQYDYVPALNAGDAHVRLLASIVQQHLKHGPDQPLTPVDGATNGRTQVRGGAGNTR